MKENDSLARENRQLQLAVNELSVLNEVATAISSTQPVEGVIEEIVRRCIRHLRVEEGVVSLLAAEDGQAGDKQAGAAGKAGADAPQFQTMVRSRASSSEKIPLRLDTRLAGWMMKNRAVLLSNDIRDDERFRFLDSGDFRYSSLLCTPLMIKGKLTGYLAVFNKKDSGGFSEEDKRLLSIIASQSAQVIENARLYEEEKALIALQEEMRMAREIQLNLLPKHTPELPGYELFAVNLPARSVGGDYYDFVRPASGGTGFCVGDITGKGMPAAMLMANLQATFRSQAMGAGDCRLCLTGTNRLLCRSTEPSKFATLFYGVLRPEEGVIDYANGGHDAALLFRGGDEPERLEATGLLLGVVEETDYEGGRVNMDPGDWLLLYTDGITEAMNVAQEEFGLDRLIDLGRSLADVPAEKAGRAILEAVRTHAGSNSQSDDITLMVIRRTA
ncbi:MAG: GAF domain-containing SpoIIE family protein phosphatase [Balneolaceae bacterium]|nr:GAF domain-containing SpoIIE family protein phosphatase [Balneolaceae bacterium]